MHNFKKALSAAFAVLVVACGSGDPVNGTWNQPNGSISIPQALGGGTVASNNTLVFDDSVSPASFKLTMDLSFMGLTDTLEAHGTYSDQNNAVAFQFTGFDIPAGSMDSAAVDSSGNQCVTLNQLAGAVVCFQAQQSDSYQVSNETLTIGIVNEIVGGPMGPTTLTLTKSQ
jgi:hypothetical protein